MPANVSDAISDDHIDQVFMACYDHIDQVFMACYDHVDQVFDSSLPHLSRAVQIQTWVHPLARAMQMACRTAHVERKMACRTAHVERKMAWHMIPQHACGWHGRASGGGGPHAPQASGT